MNGKWPKPLTFKAQNAVKKATVNKRVLWSLWKSNYGFVSFDIKQLIKEMRCNYSHIMRSKRGQRFANVKH